MKYLFFWLALAAGSFVVLRALNSQDWAWWQWALFIYAEICIIAEIDNFTRSKT